MTHYHLEVVMPRVDDVDATVTQILAPFDESGKDDDDYGRRHAFWSYWNYWKIGGRWSGAKLLCLLGSDRVTAFEKALHDAGISVSTFRFGKPTLDPASQAEMVNMMWRNAFPDSPVSTCPLFDNYQDRYGDVMPLGKCPKGLTCDSLIIAGPPWTKTNESPHCSDNLTARYMLHAGLWNGITWQKTTWDKTLSSAVAESIRDLKGARPEYALPRTPTDDWLVVTVDYHS